MTDFIPSPSGKPRIGRAVIGGTATRVLFVGTGGVLDDAATLVFDEAAVRLTVGTGSGASAGLTLGNFGSNSAAIYATGVTVGASTYALYADGLGTVALNSSASGNVNLNRGALNVLQITPTAGAGPSITAGTATTDVNALSVTQTWNGAVSFTMDKANATATSATNGSAVIDRQVNGGSLFRVEYYAANVTAAAGATVTATNLIPAKAQLIGIATRITTQLGNGSGTTGYSVGDGSDADRWGVAGAVTVGTVTDQDSATADPSGYFNAANNVVLTATGGNFDGTGVIRVVAAVLTMQAPTS